MSLDAANAERLLAPLNGEQQALVDAVVDMTNELRLWARVVDVRGGFEHVAGRHAIVGDDDADPRVARIVATDAVGNLELQILPGSVESHLDLLARA